MSQQELLKRAIQTLGRLKARAELFEKLAVAQAQAAAGEKGFTHAEVMKKLSQRLHVK